ncbi:DUF2332 domain-containing protein [Nocardiopsis rhodophaea]|uniref:DUF2332 domain-containing protein n=1 Tax=Nocardiopsis rhodophaea TaxID=280238 RepID=A0ABP5EZ92_9ACTN
MTTTAIATRYHHFATHEATTSPLYTELARGIAADPTLLALLNTLPPRCHQPNLLFAATRHLTGTPTSFPHLRRTLLDNWHRIAPLMQRRRTQTNEPARCAPLHPLLTALPQPLTLIEVGASAGLCLYPDRYAYDTDDHLTGDPHSPLRITAPATGPTPPPHPHLDIAARIGIDLNPLDIHDPDDTRWLHSLIWPEHHQRTQRLDAAIAIARTDPPHLIQGDLNERLPDAIAHAPADTTLVVFHTTVLTYLSDKERDRFTDQIRPLDLHWFAQEPPAALPHITAPEPDPSPGITHLLCHNEHPLAYTDPHTGAAHWFA